MPRKGADEEAVAMVHEVAAMFGLAVYETARLAQTPSKDGANRRRVTGLWTEVADKIIQFATED